MRLLLDSHVLVWWMADDRRLGAARRRAIARAEARFSPVSVWELRLKQLAGKVDFGERALAEEWTEHGFAELPLTSEHAERALALPAIHRDPIDRFLVAQALVEGLTLVTDDETIRRYPVATL